MRVYASLPEVTMKKKGIEQKKEIYVVSLASDLRGESNHRPPAVGANNETLKDISPDIEAAMKFMVVSVSNIFENVTPKQPVSLSGDGIVLYPPADPQGMLALHFAIVESDKKTRNVGKVLGELLGDKSVKSFFQEIAMFTAAKASVPSALLTSLFGVVAATLPKVLQNNRDDLLFSHSHSGVDFTAYGGSPEGKAYAVGNDRAAAKLVVWARE